MFGETESRYGCIGMAGWMKMGVWYNFSIHILISNMLSR